MLLLLLVQPRFSSSVSVGDYLRLTKASSTDIQAYTGSAYSNLNYDVASHNWQCSGGTAKMVLTSSGNVGIGVVPSAFSTYKALQIGAYSSLVGQHNGTRAWLSNNAYFDGTNWKYIVNGPCVQYNLYDGEHRFNIASSGTANNNISFTQAMTITTAGNLLIGTTTSNNHKLEIVSGSTSALRVSVDSGTCGISMSPGALFQIDKPGVGGGTFQITSGGNVLINTTTNNGERLYVDGAIRATGTITANSDLTLKKNLLKIENALEKVEQINGYTYEFKEDDSKRHAGLIAQEVEIVLPEIVNAGADKIKGIEYGNISALLVEAIKELSTEINII